MNLTPNNHPNVRIVQVLDCQTKRPTVAILPVIFWRIDPATGRTTPIVPGHDSTPHYDFFHDAGTDQCWSDYGETWPSLKMAVNMLHRMHSIQAKAKEAGDAVRDTA